MSEFQNQIESIILTLMIVFVFLVAKNIISCVYNNSNVFCKLIWFYETIVYGRFQQSRILLKG